MFQRKMKCFQDFSLHIYKSYNGIQGALKVRYEERADEKNTNLGVSGSFMVRVMVDSLISNTSDLH